MTKHQDSHHYSAPYKFGAKIVEGLIIQFLRAISMDKYKEYIESYFDDIKNLIGIVGIVFFSTTASMMILTILPIFLSEKLHLTFKQIGLIEGLAAFSSFIAKCTVGFLSDKVGKRKSFIIMGTFLSALSKALFVIATGFTSIFIVRIFDRLAKGARSSPIDAMIADIVPNKTRGLYYGIKYTLFMLGAIFGGYITHYMIVFVNGNFHLIFILATIPALIAHLLSITFLKEKKFLSIPKEKESKGSPKGSILKNLSSLSKDYWLFLSVIFFLMFARFSESFALLKAREIGFEISQIPLLSLMYDLCAAIFSLIFAFISLKVNKIKILFVSLITQIIANIVFGFAFSKITIIIGGVIAGMHMGMSQGILLATISRFTNENNRATAFSVYYFVASFGLLFGNIIAGSLNDSTNNTSMAFFGGIVFSTIALIMLNKIIKPKCHNWD